MATKQDNKQITRRVVSRRKRQAAHASIEQRAHALIADATRDIDTRQAVQLALQNMQFYQRGADGHFTAAELPTRRAEAERELRALVARVAAGARVTESGVAPEYEQVARTVISLLGLPGAPDFLTDSIMTMLDQVAAATGAGLWQEIDHDVATGNYSVSILARTIARHSALKLRLAPAQDLPALISAVLQHPDTPPQIYNGLAEAINDSFNDLSTRQAVSDAAAYIRLVLDQHQREQAAQPSAG